MGIRNLVAAGAMALTVLGASAPVQASAQHHIRHKIRHRRQTESQWRTGTYAGAALGAIGLATHKDTVTAIGAGIAGYSGYRWSQDMKSRHHLEHRAQRIRRHHHYVPHRHHN